MNRIARLAVLVASLMSLFAMLSATAGAVTWHNTGDTAFTATNPSTGTISVTGVNYVCHNATMTGTSPGASVVGATYPAATGTLTSSPCFLGGIPTHFACGFALTTTSAGPLSFSGALDLNCSLTQFGTEICKIEGQTAVTYHNPEGSFGRLTLLHSSTLRTTNGSGGSCPLGVGESYTLTAQSYTVTNGTGGPMTPHTGPTLIRTV